MLFQTPVFGDERPRGPLRIRRDLALTEGILLAAVWEGLRAAIPGSAAMQQRGSA